MKEYCEPLKKLRKSIPGFDKDALNALETIFNQYLKILVRIGSDPNYEQKTKALRGGSVDIRTLFDLCRKAAKTKKEGVYYRIVNELTADINALMNIIECD